MNVPGEGTDDLTEAIAASVVDYFEGGGAVKELGRLTDWDDIRITIRALFPEKYLKMVAVGWFG